MTPADQSQINKATQIVTAIEQSFQNSKPSKDGDDDSLDLKDPLKEFNIENMESIEGKNQLVMLHFRLSKLFSAQAQLETDEAKREQFQGLSDNEAIKTSSLALDALMQLITNHKTSFEELDLNNQILIIKQNLLFTDTMPKEPDLLNQVKSFSIRFTVKSDLNCWRIAINRYIRSLRRCCAIETSNDSRLNEEKNQLRNQVFDKLKEMLLEAPTSSNIIFDLSLLNRIELTIALEDFLDSIEIDINSGDSAEDPEVINRQKFAKQYLANLKIKLQLEEYYNLKKHLTERCDTLPATPYPASLDPKYLLNHASNISQEKIAVAKLNYEISNTLRNIAQGHLKKNTAYSRQYSKTFQETAKKHWIAACADLFDAYKPDAMDNEENAECLKLLGEQLANDLKTAAANTEQEISDFKVDFSIKCGEYFDKTYPVACSKNSSSQIVNSLQGPAAEAAALATVKEQQAESRPDDSIEIQPLQEEAKEISGAQSLGM